MLKVLGLHFHGLTSYGQLNSFGAAREKKSILGSILGHDALFFFAEQVPGMKFCILFCR